MSDHIIRAITADGSVKAVAITGRDLVERARTIHTLLPVATAALGRSLLGASILEVRSPVREGFPVPFGMLKWLDSEGAEGWDWSSTGYLGLAFD